MGLHVTPQTPLVGESFLTDVTLERTHPNVTEHVGMQATIVHEVLVADLALRTVLAVGAQVRDHRVVVEKPFFTYRALDLVEFLLLVGGVVVLVGLGKILLSLVGDTGKIAHYKTALHGAFYFFTKRRVVRYVSCPVCVCA